MRQTVRVLFGSALWLFIGTLLGLPVIGRSASEVPEQETTQKLETKATQTDQSSTELIYKPPKRGMPDGRVAGGTRGGEQRALPMILAVAPEHVGLTGEDQPTLYWYLSTLTQLPVRFILAANQTEQALVDTRLALPPRAGIQVIRLADYGVTLKPGLVYRWQITVGPDPKHRSGQVFAGGTIEQQAYPDILSEKIKKSGKPRLPILFAEEGYWYDAIAAISVLIDGAPTDRDLRMQRASLFTQVGLTKLADAELRGEGQ